MNDDDPVAKNDFVTKQVWDGVSVHNFGGGAFEAENEEALQVDTVYSLFLET
jgi:hypothetical protein